MEHGSVAIPLRYDYCFVSQGATRCMCPPPVSWLATDHLQHAFLQSRKKEKLKGLVSFVETWTKQRYHYLGLHEGNVEKRWKEDS
jgi:hypothetical protein